MSTNSTGDELMNAKLNAGIIEVSDVVETEQSASIPVATVLDVSSAEPETKSLETKQDDDEEEEVSKEENEEKEEEKGGLNMLADVTCFKMKQIFKLKEHYSDWKYVFSSLSLSPSLSESTQQYTLTHTQTGKYIPRIRLGYWREVVQSRGIDITMLEALLLWKKDNDSDERFEA